MRLAPWCHVARIVGLLWLLYQGSNLSLLWQTVSLVVIYQIPFFLKYSSSDQSSFFQWLYSTSLLSLCKAIYVGLLSCLYLPLMYYFSSQPLQENLEECVISAVWLYIGYLLFSVFATLLPRVRGGDCTSTAYRWAPADGIGHASLQFGPSYASWWPSDKARQRMSKPTVQRAASAMCNSTEPIKSASGVAVNLAQDIKNEGCQATETFIFFHLNQQAMTQKWVDEYRDREREWEALGRNCAYVVIDLLITGGATYHYRLYWNILLKCLPVTPFFVDIVWNENGALVFPDLLIFGALFSMCI